MSEKILFKSIDFFLRSRGLIKRIIFTGGEPSLKIDLVAEGLNYIQAVRKSYKKKQIIALINTNGTILTDRILEDYGKLDYIAVSLDGLTQTHDYSRETDKSQKTFSTVINNINVIKRNYAEKLIISKIITSGTYGSLIEDIRFIYSLRPKFISLNIALGDHGWNEAKVKDFFQKVKKLDLWFKKNWRSKNFRDTFKLFFKDNPIECIFGYLTADTTGELYTCEILADIKKDCLGDIKNNFIKESLVDCRYSPLNEKCAKELCRECDQVCLSSSFNKKMRSNSLLSDKVEWLKRVRLFHSPHFFKGLIPKQNVSSKTHEVLSRSLRII